MSHGVGRSNAPTSKVAAGGAAGAATIMLVYIAGLLGLEVPPEAASAVTVLIGFAAKLHQEGDAMIEDLLDRSSWGMLPASASVALVAVLFLALAAWALFRTGWRNVPARLRDARGQTEPIMLLIYVVILIVIIVVLFKVVDHI